MVMSSVRHTSSLQMFAECCQQLGISGFVLTALVTLEMEFAITVVQVVWLFNTFLL